MKINDEINEWMQIWKLGVIIWIKWESWQVQVGNWSCVPTGVFGGSV